MTGIFSKEIPIDILYRLLDKICVKKNNNSYLFDYNSYRVMMYHEYNVEFIDLLMEYYNPSKQYYLTRDSNYNSFVTIIRHICKLNIVEFKTKVIYQHSIYHIEYIIYIKKNNDMCMV
jgi:hypothetical protein